MTGYRATPIKPTIPLINPTYFHPFKTPPIATRTDHL